MGIEATRHLPSMTYCVYIRGIATGGAFSDTYCRQQYLTRLINLLEPYQVKLHAFTILENEAFLLMTPQSSSGLTGVLETTQKYFGEYYQTRFERDSSPISKTIWASEVKGYRFTLDCQKLIERLEVDTGLSNSMGSWQCSSYSSNAFGCKPQYLSPHRHLLRFLAENGHAYSGYREFISMPIPSPYYSYLLTRIKSGQPIAKKRATRASIAMNRVKRCKPSLTKRTSLSYTELINY